MLVTGTSSGLGASVAIQAAQAGYLVYATMRNLEKRNGLEGAAEAAGVPLRLLELDVADTASVNAAVDRIMAKEGRIDVLVANAGISFARSTEQASEDDISKVLDINFMGVVRCVKAVLPHMRQARFGHVIAISSGGGLVGQPFNEIYCASKFALEGYIEGLASYVGPAFGLHFTAVEPGGISSQFAASALKQIEETGGIRDDAYKPIMMKYLGSREGRTDGIFQTPDEVAEVVIDCMTSDDPPIRTRTSEWSERFSTLKTQADPDGKRLQKQVIGDMLGDLS
ncbi:SDR family oxidoreductase [Notoacmeibacter marinus]|uniref:SDR family oxidoreductase n=1 Tax=Notoacmeibacter marinus TaxID=1876515 RepID=UPI000DF1A699|nr:SDR family oxidoreductase [Notoacmeibacter marinus]